MSLFDDTTVKDLLDRLYAEVPGLTKKHQLLDDLLLASYEKGYADAAIDYY